MKTDERKKPLQKEYHDLYSDTYDSVELWEISGKPNKFRLGFISRRAALMTKLAKSNVHSVVLEIGCGTGIYTSHWLKTSKVIYGLDISSAMLKKAAVRLDSEQVVLIQADAECLPFLDCSFDVVYSVNLVEHLDDIPQALKEMRRVCKNGARVVISLPNDNPITAELYRLYSGILGHVFGWKAFKIDSPDVDGVTHNVPPLNEVLRLFDESGIKVEGRYFMGFIERRLTRIIWAHGLMEFLEIVAERIPIMRSWAGITIISGLVSK